MKSLSEYLTESSITRDDVFAKIKNLSETGIAEVEEVESGFGEKNSKKFTIHYKKGLTYSLDFLNSYEYIWEYESPDGKKLSTNSTDDIDRTDWDRELNPKLEIPFRMRNIDKLISKAKGEYTRYHNQYNRTGKSDDSMKAYRASERMRILQARKERYEHFLKFV